MEAPWISVYEPKEWTVYTVLFASPDQETLDDSLKIMGDRELFVCGAESEAAANHWHRTHSIENVFFYDIEQLWAMGLDRVYGVREVGMLTTEWKGHPSGSLVLSVYKGVTEEPRFFTVGIANPMP